MLYPIGFFDLQLIFAKKIAQLTQQSYPETILYGTAMYRILGLDWSLDPRHPVWQTYLTGLHQEDTDTDWSYQFYLERADQIPSYEEPRWGCFSYEYWSERRMIHLHFANLDGFESSTERGTPGRTLVVVYAYQTSASRCYSRSWEFMALQFRSIPATLSRRVWTLNAN